MTYDFDTVVDRSQTGSLKWDAYGDRDILPMWVADMDFRAPPPILQALHAHIDHGVLGYTTPSDEVVTAVVDGLKRKHGLDVDPSLIVWFPGVVAALHIIAKAYTAEEEEILTLTPIYPPFLSTPPFMHRRLNQVPMVVTGSGYQVDFDAFEAAITERTKVFFHCNPQNPTGRVFTLEEQQQFDAICRRHGVFVCSDEIHCDLILDRDREHIPFFALGDEAADNSIILMAPSKTYNVPGLNASFALTPNRSVKRKLTRAMGHSLPYVNALGYTACMAAYRDCEDWRQELLAYLRDNLRLVNETINGLPGLSMIPGEATYLAWIDARGLDVPNPVAFFEDAGVGLSDGRLFGAPGFLRLNFGCPRHTLCKGLERLARAVKCLNNAE